MFIGKGEPKGSSFFLYNHSHRGPTPRASKVKKNFFTMAIFVFWPYFAPEKTPLFAKLADHFLRFMVGKWISHS